jgi:DNA processing protein
MEYATVNPGDSNYPQLLASAGVNKTIWLRGNEVMLDALTNSIVVTGARASTGYGEHVTMDFVSRLTENHGKTIVSGGGYGIEGMALRASLASNYAPILWLAGGVDRLYPSGHDTLFQRILGEGGLIVSTEEPGSAPTRERFLARSNTMALATGAVLVTEAGWRSGSLNTARAAFANDTPVYGVPGPVTSPASSGVHRIIQEGVATLVTEASDIRFFRMS